MRVTFKRDARDIAPVNGVAPVRAVDAESGRQTPQQAPDAQARGGHGAARGKPREARAFDAGRVAELRAALAEGRIEFDAAKLAGLIQRYHGSKK
ncbi:flagellar biosynthesis anti-sigma factor FlgM [Trinickia mobilis]|uniref:flagellar biosynthesis anti-sigma factor FlgM n=1 Tax=Trinickia mobilis TaxID=2816356 RepID=UPI001F5D92AA|nr:flagellar biosynthesis anti-sigma factor FlgM [Trinickia mobilis]